VGAAAKGQVQQDALVLAQAWREVSGGWHATATAQHLWEVALLGPPWAVGQIPLPCGSARRGEEAPAEAVLLEQPVARSPPLRPAQAALLGRPAAEGHL
jgi:hypothetical protein